MSAPTPAVVSREEWQQAREELMAAEKDATRLLDRLAAQRRRLPMTPFPGDIVLTTPDGPRTVLECFDGRSQLVVYQFMDNGPDAYCPGCTWFTNNVPPTAPGLLALSDVTWLTVSNMPLQQIAGYWAETGWTLPFASSRGTAFTDECGVGGGFALTTFLRVGDDVFRTWNTFSRGVDRLVFTNDLLDHVIYGRQQDWEDSPAGWPQHPTYG